MDQSARDKSANEIRLPKNIRQIGSVSGGCRVYLEDYAYTFIMKMKKQDEPSAGILVGEQKIGKDDVRYLFINGAVAAADTYMEGQVLHINDFTKATILEKQEKYFPKAELCGWFFCSPDQMEFTLESLYETSSKHFPEEDSVFFWYRQGDEAFYVPRGRHLEKLSGYYVYYERNEAMQEYMISRSPKKIVKPAEQEEVVKNFREVMKQKKEVPEKKNSHFSLAVAALLVATVAVSGYKMMQNKEDPLPVSGQVESTTQEESAGTSGQGSVIVEEIPGNVYMTEEGGEETLPVSSEGSETTSVAPQPSGESSAAKTQAPETQAPETQAPQTEAPQTTAAQTQEPQTTTAQTQPEQTQAQTASAPETYTVKAGDTLSSISMAVYHNEQMIREICEINGIENPDFLYEGQVLKMP